MTKNTTHNPSKIASDNAKPASNIFFNIAQSLYRYKLHLSIIVAIGVIATAALYINNSIQEESIRQNSILYADLLNIQDIAESRIQVKKIQQGDDIYSILASFSQTKKEFNAKEYEKAKQYIDYITKNTATDSVWQHLSKTYLAQIEWQQGNTKAAFELLDQLPKHFDYYKAIVKGDIYQANKQKDKAIAHYKMALDLAKEKKLNTRAIEVKLNAI